MIKYVLQNLAALGFGQDEIVTTLEARMKCGIGLCGRCNIRVAVRLQGAPCVLPGAAQGAQFRDLILPRLTPREARPRPDLWRLHAFRTFTFAVGDEEPWRASTLNRYMPSLSGRKERETVVPSAL